ncbi:hypothetical protein F4823DRAFT_575669 [Ustulina deusta]|nr:hypothetical protein F4823DRAFT_575669 [Ustulina deusta]
MANVGTTVAQLLLSEKYSDLTLVCNGQEFRVHKAIVCPQSPVIDSALKGRFEVLLNISKDRSRIRH